MNWLKRNKWYIVVGFVCLIIGSMSGESTAREELGQPKEVVKEVKVEVPVEKVKEVNKTPESCKTTIKMDNEIFNTIAEKLPELDFDGLATYVDGVTAERTRNANNCLES